MKSYFTLLSLFVCSSLHSQSWESRMIQYSCTGIYSNKESTILDYDNDGRPDILTGDNESRELFLLRNNEHGLLQLETITDTLYKTLFLKALDYNGDDMDDFLIAASTTEGEALWLCINQGNDGFLWKYVCEVPYEGVRAIEPYDYDDDGDVDIFFDDFANSNVIWKVTNDGNDMFTLNMISYTGQPTVLFGKADLDDDGDLDLLTAYYSFDELNFVLVCEENVGDMNFVTHETVVLAGGGNGSIGQFAGSALPDLMHAANYGSGNVVIYQNNGDFSFSEAPAFVNVDAYAAIGPTLDIEGDGDDDVLAVDNYILYVIKQNANGTYTTQELSDEGFGRIIGLADIDGDSLEDAISSDHTVYFRENVSAYTPPFNPGWRADPRNTLAVNLDDNPNPDIVSAGANGQVSFFTQRYDELLEYQVNLFLTGANIDYNTYVQSVLPFDRDGDGDMDLLINVSTYIFWLNNNNGSYTQQTVADGEGGYAQWVGYLDSDANHDILLFESQLKRREWNGSNYTTSTLANATSDYEVMDVDDDGDNDILYFGYEIMDQTYPIKYLKNNNGNFTDQTLFTLDDYFTDELMDFDLQIPMMKSDLDSDGDDDLVFSSTEAEYIAWFRNDGNEVFTPIVIITDLNQPGGFDITDIDGDLDLDIIVSNRGEGEIWILANDGDENFSSTPITNIVAYPEIIQTKDMDNDSDMDILYSSRVDNRMGWLKNSLVDCERSYTTDAATICAGDSVYFSGHYFSEIGMHTDTLSSAAGCDSVAVLMLDLFPVSTISISQSVNTLTASSSFAGYTWYLDDELIPAENDNTINVAAYGTGLYEVHAIDNNGCEVVSQPWNVTTIISVPELSAHDLSVYPNPFSSSLSIRSSVPLTSVRIMDLNGRLCFEQSPATSGNTVNLDLNTLSDGVYFMECVDVNGGVERKLISRK